jgi:hypothetical protein
LDWIGLPSLRDGEQLWFDLAARAVDGSHRPHLTRQLALQSAG